MFSLSDAWFLSDAVSRTPRRPLPPLTVEPLEDRLAPSAGFFSSFGIADSGLSTVPAEAAALVFGIAAHVALSKGDARPLLDSVEGGTTFTPLFPAASKLDLDRDGPDDRPFLAAVVSAHADGQSLGSGLLRSALSGLLGGPAAPAVPLGIGFVSTSLMPMPVKPANPTMNFSASASAVASQNALAYLPKRPSSGDALGFPSFNPAVRKPANEDRPLNFALSPFDSSGLDIVPVPVPRGLEEKLADLFGDPPPEPPSAFRFPLSAFRSPASTSGDKGDAGERNAVLQMLQESGPFARTIPQQLPLPAAEDTPPYTATDAFFSAGTPLDPNSEDEMETIPATTRSVLAFLAAGAVLAGQQRETRREQKR